MNSDKNQSTDKILSLYNNGRDKVVRRKRHPMTGRYFHRIENDVLTWQGRIVSVIDDHVLVQLYSWIMGEESTQHLLPLRMLAWSEKPANGFLFYSSTESMRFAYEHGAARWYRASIGDEVRPA
jgi:hypothetical protein